MTFFIVFSPEGVTPPIKQHTSHKEALGIAHMMAERHPGQSFFVMKSASKPVCREPVSEEPAQ